MPLEIFVGDITTRADDAIVNSANPTLLAGGGVSGAIHRVAGPELEAACKLLGRCAVGDAVPTSAFNLPSKHVIHAVAPRWMGGERGEPELLRSCHVKAFEVALGLGANSIALPALGIGIYRYPLEAAAQIAVDVCRTYSDRGLSVALVLFDGAIADVYRAKLGRT
jgi:O-acetyl-ADP-ribose deacetylase (regulator of RNase III)